MEKQPLVSALVGCFNHEDFVIHTLESIRAQTYLNIELVIWDDSSRDNSVKVISEWIQRNGIECTFLRHNENQGICRSLNQALSFAKGDYIAMVAADDLWLPDKIERHVDILLNSSDNIGLVFGDAFLIDNCGNMLPGMFIESHTKNYLPRIGNYFDLLWQHNFIPAMGTLIRRSCLNRVGCYDEDLCYEDHDMWLRISRFYSFIYDSAPCARYRILQTSAVRTMGAAMSESENLFRVKCYFRSWLNHEQSRVALEALEGVMWNQYQRNVALPKKWKFKLLTHRRTPKVFVLILCSMCGLNFAEFKRVLNYCVKVKNYVMSYM